MTPAVDERANVDPFAFPSTTDSRFMLLILAVVGATTYVYSWLSLKLPDVRLALTRTAQECSAAADQTNAALAAALGGNLDPFQNSYGACIADTQIRLALWSLSGLPLLVLVAAALYWWLPRWIARRRGLVELDPGDAADVLQSLQDTSRAMGLRAVPEFLGTPGTRSTGALAFGHAGHRRVALNNGLLTLFYLQPARFDAIVRHELAHIRNADIDKAYLTISASLAFVIVGLLPFALSMLGQPLEDVLAYGIRAAGLALLVAVSGAAVLRARECYADVRAAHSPGAARALEELFAAAPPVQTSTWRRPLRLHLDPLERLAVLRDARSLLRAEALELVATGLAAALVLPRILGVTSGLAVRLGQSLSGPFVGALLLTPLIVGILGLAIWRAMFASVVGGMPTPHYARLAFGLGAGMALGSLLSFDSYVETLFEPVGFVTVNLAWGIVVGAVVYVFLRWQAAACTSWLESHAGRPPSRREFLLGLGVVGVVLLPAMTVLLFSQSNAAAMNGLVTDGVLGGVGAVLVAFGAGLFLVVTNLPLLTAGALIALWAYPLAVGGRRTIGRALLAGVVGGCVYVVVDLIFDRQFQALPAALRATDAAKLQLVYSLIPASLVLQTAVAVFVAWRAPSAKLAHALLGAFICGCTAVVAYYVIHIGFDIALDVPTLVSMYIQMVSIGGLLATLSGGIAARLSSRAQSPRALLLRSVAIEKPSGV